MRTRQIKIFWQILLFSFLAMLAINNASADTTTFNDDVSIDRVQLVTRQIDLLKSRFKQAEKELQTLQQQHDEQ